ncbi:hypothetical protein D3C81_1441140 [compost metagenome]
MCEWLYTTALIGFLPRCSLTRSKAAFAVSLDISGSNTIQPELPCTKVMLDRS